MDGVREIARDVYCLGPHGRSQTNVYLVGSAALWLLVDAGWRSDAPRIVRGAARLFGPDARPAAILLTHVHPDHSGAARDLAIRWRSPVVAHPHELPIACGSFHAMWRHAGPLDRYVILPAISALGRRRRDAMLRRNSLGGEISPLEPGGHVPALPEWLWVHTPGHTPGHVAYLRRSDGVLISGDALVTLRVNSLAGMVLGRSGLSGPPWYTTSDASAARRSVRTIASVAPRILAGGHGPPLAGPDTAGRIRAFSVACQQRARSRARGATGW